jgi:methyl-accepting chemotaxis protein
MHSRRFENWSLVNKLILPLVCFGFVLPLLGFWLTKLYFSCFFPAVLKEDTSAFPSVAAYLVSIFLLLGIALLLMFVYSIVRLFVIKPLRHVHLITENLAKGEFSRTQTNPSKDEIGCIMALLNLRMDILQASSSFARQMAEGNLDASFNSSGHNDSLEKALLKLQINLQEVKKEEKRRSWSRDGYAQFSDILRNTYQVKTLAAHIISQLVKYMGANQGGLFIGCGEEENPETYTKFELAAAYAYGRKKHLTKTICLGEGLVGACVQEKDTIYLTDVPQGYCTITSGLGEATPSSILIVPLKIEERVLGIIELASFKEFPPYEIEFVEKIAISIASTILSIQTNEKTLQLLAASRQQSEELKAGEEELRQNLEELAATQDEMGRSKKEIEQLLQDSLRKEVIMQEQENMMRASLEEITLMQKQLYEKDRMQVKEINTLQQSFQAKEKEMNLLLEEMQVSEKDMQQTEDNYRKLLIDFQTLQQSSHTLKVHLEQAEAENQQLKKSLKV